ncbi:MAG: nuclear transport factor 2 family protein [Pseudomonadota bacterium]
MDEDKATDENNVITANERFYEAFRSGDFAAMETVWSARDDVCVYHPNWPGILGREDVMASWYQVMVLTEPPPVFTRDPTVIIARKTAMVFCTEVLGDTSMTASNVFVREHGAWKLTSHHASPVALNVQHDETSKDRDN